MAATVTGRRLTEAHRNAQARLAATVALRVRGLFRLLDPEDLAGSAPGWVDAISTAVAAQHETSTALGRRYFSAFRAAEIGAAAGALDRLAPDLEALRTSLYVVGPVRIERARRRGEDVASATRIAEAASSRAAGRHAINGGRETILRAVAGDRQALGYARATSGDPCHFCALLAARGAAFGSEDSAGFQAHDGCACTPEPVFGRDAPLPPGSADYARLYEEVARGESNPRIAFRRAFEGR